MTYLVNYSDAAKDPIVLDSMEKDTTSTSITLHGRGAKNYGEDQQENFLHLLENFASDTSPLYPTEGQLWYDTGVTPKLLKVWNGTEWVQISLNSTVQPTTPQQGTTWYDSANNSLLVWNGTDWVQVSLTNNTALPPTAPQVGTTWYDVTNQIQMVYTSTGWQPITNNIVDPSLQYLAIVFS